MEIDLLRLIKSLLKRWWFIGLLTLVFTVTVFVYTDRYITPLYTAYTTVYIQNTADYQGYISSGDLLSSQQLANTFRVLLRSNKVMELVAEQVDLGYSPAYLSSMVSAVSVNNTEVMRVSVTNENAQHAQAIANAVGEVASREITSFFNAGKVVVVDTAALPAVPSYPDTRTNTMTGALLGFLLACAIIILKELLDTRIKTESDLRRFTQLPLIGVIPNHSKHKRRLWGSAKKRRNGVLTAESLPIVGEAYRAVRTNLMFLMANKEYKTVLVTSASPSEGKTTTCTNLAITLAKANKKVLIIDSDMRNPGVHKTLTIAQTPGLSDILGGFSDLSCIHETDIEHLSVLTAGTIPPNPAELLVSPLFGELIRALSQVYEYVFLDTPPVNLFADALSISGSFDGVILVTEYLRSRELGTKQMIDKLEKVNAKLLGIVINNYDRKNYYRQFGAGKTGRYYSKYGYGIESDARNK